MNARTVVGGVVAESRVRRETICPGRIEGAGRRGKPEIADYVLTFRNHKLAVIEAKAAKAEKNLKNASELFEGVPRPPNLVGPPHCQNALSIDGPISVIIGYLHGVSGLLAIFGSPIAFTLIGRSLASSEPQLLLSHRLRWATLAARGGLGSFLASVTVIRLTGQMDTPVPPWVSLANRFLIMTYCIWFIAAAWSAKCTPSFSS